jgi:hypothetical protein
LDKRCSSAGIRRVVVRSHSLARHPVVHPVRYGGQGSSVAITAVVIDRSIIRSVCLENGHLLARLALSLTWCICVHGIGVASGQGSCVEGTRVCGNGCEYCAKIRITGEHATEAASVTVAHRKDASGIDTEHALYDCDKLLHVDQVPLLLISRSCSSDAVIWVRLPTCRSADTLHVDGDGERIGACVVQPGLPLNILGRPLIAMEREDDRRCPVDVVVSRNMYEETSRYPIRRSHVESRTWAIRGQVCRQSHTTTSACSCDWDGEVRLWWNISDQSCLTGTRICEPGVR